MDFNSIGLYSFSVAEGSVVLGGGRVAFWGSVGGSLGWISITQASHSLWSTLTLQGSLLQRQPHQFSIGTWGENIGTTFQWQIICCCSASYLFHLRLSKAHRNDFFTWRANANVGVWRVTFYTDRKSCKDFCVTTILLFEHVPVSCKKRMREYLVGKVMTRGVEFN